MIRRFITTVADHTSTCIRGRHLRRALLSSLMALGVSSATLATTASDEHRAVILLIGDGFDDQHVTMGRNYLMGAAGELTLDTLPIRAAVQVETVDAQGKPVYVADSANTATTLAGGQVTEIGRVGTDRQDKDIETLLEQAAAAGYRTGIVATASVTDATPASFMAHVSNRGCENPEIIMGGERYGSQYPGCPDDARNNGGPGSIAEQIIASPAHVVLGGGLKHFDYSPFDSDITLLEQAKSQGIAVATDLDSLLTSDKDARLLGLFAPKHLPVRLRGADGRKAEAVTGSLLNKVDERLGTVEQPAPMACEPNPEFGTTPTLATLTEVALDRLSRNNDRGLFLMIESASIDKQSHARNPCGSIGEIEQLEEALAVALTYAELHPNTLVLVTADHAQAAQIVPEPSLFEDLPLPSYTPGKIARIETPEGGLMAINYATTVFPSEEHTGANVPLFGNAQALGVVKPFMRQRDVYQAMRQYLGL